MRRAFDAFHRPREWANWQATNADELSTSAAGNAPRSRRGFTQHEQIDSTSLVHMNGRVYDADIGRFYGVDPFVQFPANSQSLNPYSYIMNNPMAGTDPTGYEASSICNKATGGCTGSDFGTNSAGYALGESVNAVGDGVVRTESGVFRRETAKDGSISYRQISSRGNGAVTSGAITPVSQTDGSADGPSNILNTDSSERLGNALDTTKAGFNLAGDLTTPCPTAKTGAGCFGETAVTAGGGVLVGSVLRIAKKAAGEAVTTVYEDATRLGISRAEVEAIKREANENAAANATKVRSPASQIDRTAFASTRREFWRNEAETNAAQYSPDDVARMRKGRATIGSDGFPMELHHADGTPAGELRPMTQTEHRRGKSYTENHPWLTRSENDQ